MRTYPTMASDCIILIGTGERATAALWNLCATGARIRWYADRFDVGEEAVLAHALGGGRIELTFDDPLAAPLDGAAAVVIAGDGSHDHRLAERARACGVPVHFVAQPERSNEDPAGLVRAAVSA